MSLTPQVEFGTVSGRDEISAVRHETSSLPWDFRLQLAQRGDVRFFKVYELAFVRSQEDLPLGVGKALLHVVPRPEEAGLL